MTKRTTQLALLLALAGCATQTVKGPAPDLAAGKADGTVEIVESGPVSWGERMEGELAPDLAHAYTFELSGAAAVRFATEGDLDTVLYLHDADDAPITSDDDGGEGLLSLLGTELDAGGYRILVGGYDDGAEGPFGLTAECEGEGCGGEAPPDEPEEPAEDPWALARDVHTMHAAFTDATPIPELSDEVDAPGPLRLSGPEWWQRWSGGVTQNFSWESGTDYGKRCAVATSIRLDAIWSYEEVSEDGEVRRPGREAFEALIAGSGWSGGMFSWIEDVSEGGWPAFDPASMWAWRTGTVKWISVTRADGSCDLPTLDLVQRFSATCLERAEREDGAIQGCRASGR